MDYKKIKNKGIAYACGRGFKECSEDFAQEYCIEVFRERKTTIKNIFVDFLRKEYGDKRFDYGKIKSGAKRQYEGSESDDFRRISRYIGGAREYHKSDGIVFFNITEDEFFILELHKMDIDNQEISWMYGVSPSRVSQILSKIKKRGVSLNEKMFRLL